MSGGERWQRVQVLFEEALARPAGARPEQARGEEVGPAADIYALGVVLYEMVTGRLPSTGGTEIEVASPRSVVPDLDEHWEAVILRCLAREPRQRFARAEEVAVALCSRENPPRKLWWQWRGSWSATSGRFSTGQLKP